MLLMSGDALLCAPGAMFEVEEMMLAGRRQKVYKNVSSPLFSADM